MVFKPVRVSVIVPVYNLEKYVERSIDSLLRQSLTDIEIIIVNDGSTDSSGAIADEFANKDSRVISVHKKNGGVSSARNAGLKIASGEYVTFADPDDFIDTQAYERLYKAGCQTDSDVVICSFSYVSDKDRTCNDFHYPFSANTVLNQSEIRGQIIYNLYRSDMCAGVWNKLFRRQFLLNNKIRFDEALLFTEDHIFNLEVFIQAGKAVYIPEPFYKYVVSVPNSASKKYRNNYFKLYEHVYLFKLNQMSEHGMGDDSNKRAAANYFVYQSMKALINEFSKTSPNSLIHKYNKVREITDSPVLQQAVHFVVLSSPDYVKNLYSFDICSCVRNRNLLMLCAAGIYYNSFLTVFVKKLKSYKLVGDI